MTEKLKTHGEIVTPSGLSYRVLSKKLGAGGFGEVWTGMRIYDQAPVAIKYIKKSKVVEWSIYNGKKIPMEISLMIHIGYHQNIIQIYDWLECENYFVIMIEKPKNSIDLFDYITNEVVLSEKKSKGLMKQVLDAVDYCHTKGVVHRDIKDENFVIDKDTGIMKLIDFGGATWLDEDKVYKEYDGTRVYSPPEWISQQWYRAIPLTTWSLGILLYDMVQGNIPYEKDSQITSGKLKFSRHPITTDCRYLIQWCLQMNPENRPTLYQIRMHPWMRQSDDPISTRTPNRNLLQRTSVQKPTSLPTTPAIYTSSSPYASNLRKHDNKTTRSFSPRQLGSTGSNTNQSSSDSSTEDVPKRSSPIFKITSSISTTLANGVRNVLNSPTQISTSTTNVPITRSMKHLKLNKQKWI